jgi:hypothetical protein
VRSTVVGFCVAALVLGVAAPARAQFSLDARRIGMGGLSLNRDGNLRRYNAAYRAVPDHQGGERAKLTIPLPLGLIRALKDSAAFDTGKPYFNIVELANMILNPPLYYEVKRAPTPTNDITFTIGKNALVVDLGATRQLIPSDQFGTGGSSRFLDIGAGAKGFHAGVQAFVQEDIGFTLGDTLRNFLQNADTARVRTLYNMLVDGKVQGGLSPTLSYAGRIAGGRPDSEDGVYVGGALHYYLGAAYARADGTAGFRTGDTLFSGSNPVTPNVNALLYTSNRIGHAFGKGVGGDVGVACIAGPLELGVGVNDIGATLTWKDTRIRRFRFDTAGNDIKDSTIADHVETKTKLPVSYIANVSYRMQHGLTVGGDVVNNGRGTSLHVGAEQRVGALALRGGVGRDNRKRVQYGAGAGVRFGFLSLDVGFWTHSNSLSNVRGITMATSVSIY